MENIGVYQPKNPLLGKPKVDKRKDYIPQRDKSGHFLPGQSGNPRAWGCGRKPGAVSLVTLLRNYLNKHPDEARAIVESLVKEGKLGNVVATKEIFERIDGKVVETHKIEGELPIRLVFVPAQVELDRRKELPEGGAGIDRLPALNAGNLDESSNLSASTKEDNG